MLIQCSAAELITYGVMSFLIVRAIAHRAEARSRSKQLGIARAKLREVALHLRKGGSVGAGIAMARDAVRGLALADTFQMRVRDRDVAVIKERVDEAISAEFQGL